MYVSGCDHNKKCQKNFQTESRGTPMELDGVKLQLKEIVEVSMSKLQLRQLHNFFPCLSVKFKCARKNSSVATTAV